MKKPILSVLAFGFVATLFGCGESNTLGPAEKSFVASAAGTQLDAHLIDIKPGSDINPVNLKSKGVIPVAILGSDVFDVLDVDVSTLAFGPAGAPIAHANGHLEDVNDDAFLDLVTHYRTQDTGIVQGDTEACLVGNLLDGAIFEACDNVVTVPVEQPLLIGD